jgi:hypothetical protein
MHISKYQKSCSYTMDDTILTSSQIYLFYFSFVFFLKKFLHKCHILMFTLSLEICWVDPLLNKLVSIEILTMSSTNFVSYQPLIVIFHHSSKHEVLLFQI